MEVRIGIIQGGRELDVELSDDEAEADVVGRIEAALATSDGVLWLVDRRGRRVGVPAARIAYIEVGMVDPRRVGFGAV